MLKVKVLLLFLRNSSRLLLAGSVLVLAVDRGNRLLVRDTEGKMVLDAIDGDTRTAPISEIQGDPLRPYALLSMEGSQEMTLYDIRQRLCVARVGLPKDYRPYAAPTSRTLRISAAGTEDLVPPPPTAPALPSLPWAATLAGCNVVYALARVTKELEEEVIPDPPPPPPKASRDCSRFRSLRWC